VSKSVQYVDQPDNKAQIRTRTIIPSVRADS
jgi:hypothetical protein